MKKQIPNLFTLGNMLLGIMATMSFLDEEYVLGMIFIGISALLDFFDGFIARALSVSGELGKQLDSLADVVSFGVAPSVALFTILRSSQGSFLSLFERNNIWEAFLESPTTFIPLLIALFSAYRLAKFNIDTRQTDKFIGLPTPANSILILSIVYSISEGTIQPSPEVLEYGIYVLSVVSSYLLVAELPLLALKFKHFKWKGNEPRFILIITAIGIFALLGIPGLAIVVLLYLLISIIDNRIHRHEVSR